MGYQICDHEHLNDLAEEIADNAIKHGFKKDGEQRSIDRIVALLHSEVSELYEAWREGDTGNPIEGYQPAEFELAYEDNGKPIGVASEIADVIIRALDFCHEYGINAEDVIRIKMEYNKNRPYMHGGKLA